MDDHMEQLLDILGPRTSIGHKYSNKWVDLKSNQFDVFYYLSLTRLSDTVIRDYMSQVKCDVLEGLYQKYYPDFVLFNFTLDNYTHIFNKGYGCQVKTSWFKYWKEKMDLYNYPNWTTQKLLFSIMLIKCIFNKGNNSCW